MIGADCSANIINFHETLSSIHTPHCNPCLERFLNFCLSNLMDKLTTNVPETIMCLNCTLRGRRTERPETAAGDIVGEGPAQGMSSKMSDRFNSFSLFSARPREEKFRDPIHFLPARDSMTIKTTWFAVMCKVGLARIHLTSMGKVCQRARTITGLGGEKSLLSMWGC